MYIKYNILCRLFASDYKKGYNMNMKIEKSDLIFIKEKEYQEIKKRLDKKDDYLKKEDLQIFTKK